MSQQTPSPKPATLEQTQAKVLELEARIMAIQRFASGGDPKLFVAIEESKKAIHDILLRKLENKSPDVAANLDKRLPPDVV